MEFRRETLRALNHSERTHSCSGRSAATARAPVEVDELKSSSPIAQFGTLPLVTNLDSLHARATYLYRMQQFCHLIEMDVT